MNSSGIKRGLAVTAISALAVTGVPFLASSASANPVNSQVAAVTLFSQANGQASVKNDGTDATVRLEAGAPASITSVTFTYAIGAGTPQEIATVSSRNDDGAFSYEWAAPALLLGAPGVEITVTGTPAVGPAQTDTQPVLINAAGAGINSANVTAGATVGVFQSPYATGQNVIVNGTTSATAGTVDVVDVDGTGGDASTPATAAVSATGAFKAVLDISTGAPYTYSAGDELVVRAVNGTDDVESFGLYKQVITTVTAVATDPTVPTGGSTTVTVTVTDQNGNPVAGARVDSDPASAPVITDANGKATFTQNAGATRSYYADATDDAGYQAGLLDKTSGPVTVTAFGPVPTTLAATSADGAAFDFDEYAAGDVKIQVKNQNGGNFNPADSEDVQYFWQITPFAGGTAIRVPAGTATTAGMDDEGAADAPGVGDDDGSYMIAFPTGQPAGTYELFASLEADSLGNGAIASSKVLTVKAGQAKVTYDQSNPQTAAAGAQAAIDGQLVLEDGTTGLAARTVTANFARGTVGTDPAKDAGILPASGTTPVLARTFTTAADGGFSLVVDDPAETPQGTEVGGQLSAAVAFVAETETQFGVDFASTLPPAGSTVILDTETGARPGEIVSGSALVQLPDGADVDSLPDGPVAGQLVTLTVDQGFFTNGNPDPAPVVGADAAEFKSLTQTITGTTDAAGRVSYQVAIERNEGFDDDGMVKATVTATAGTGVSDTEDVDYTSANPINGGAVSLVVSPESEQDGGTDPAPLGNDVAFDVVTTDQFGNRVGGETVNLSEDGDDATVSAATATSDFEDDGDFTVTSTEDDTVTVTASWTTTTLKYTTATGSGSPAAGPNETVTDTADVEFAEFDLSAADLYLTSRPTGTVPVGGAVTETLTVVDEFGDLGPAGLEVTFTRVGPGAATEIVTRTTNANGQAAYAFVGTVRGTATVHAEVTDGSQVKSIQDSVTFAPVGPRAIKATITGNDNGATKDKIKVSTTPAAKGATVRLFKIVNGKKVAAGMKKLPANGKASFAKPDTNRNGVTKYYVVVDKTATTKADRSNTLRLR